MTEFILALGPPPHSKDTGPADNTSGPRALTGDNGCLETSRAGRAPGTPWTQRVPGDKPGGQSPRDRVDTAANQLPPVTAPATRPPTKLRFMTFPPKKSVLRILCNTLSNNARLGRYFALRLPECIQEPADVLTTRQALGERETRKQSTAISASLLSPT